MERTRRQLEDLRDSMFSGVGGHHSGGVRDRLGGPSSPPRPSKPRERGVKLIVKNFPSSMSDSEFYSMFVRKGENIDL